MSVIIATPEEVEQYYLSEDLNQSKLKCLLGNLSDFNKEFDSTAEHFLIGSAVDCLLTSTQEDFDQKYYVSQMEKTPSEAVVDILKQAHSKVVEKYARDLEVVSEDSEPVVLIPFTEWVGPAEEYGERYREEILEAATIAEWQPRWGADAKLSNILKEEGIQYFTDLCFSTGKTIMSATQKSTIDGIVNSLKTNPRTSHFFNREAFENPFAGNVTIYYQFPLYFEYEGIKCKALLDILILVRDEEGKILEAIPADVKTMHGNTYHFLSSLKTRRYDIQAAWYVLGLMMYFNISEEVIKPFQFIVESSTNPGKPLVFSLDKSLLSIGMQGRKPIKLVDTNLFNEDALPETTISYEILGVKQLLEKFKYHSENGFFLEREIQEAGINPLTISWEGFVESQNVPEEWS